jgi:predicted DNA-binding transcriptional regulator YafY
MPLNKDFTRRIEVIDECLRRRQKKWFVEDLLEAVNSKLDERFDKKVSKRTLYDDLKYLQEEKDAPIVKCREGQRVYYKYEDATYSVLNLPISEEEITRLKDAIKMLREVSDFNILEEVDLIVEKLEHTVSTNVPESRSMIQFEKHTNADGTEFIDDIFEAIKGRSVLKIIYQPFGTSEPQEWIVHPYLLKEYRNRWFIICRREGSDQISNLALDRIRKIQNSSVPFRENDLFDPETYYDNLIGVSFPAGERVQDVILKITGSQVNYIKTKPIHKTQEFISQEAANSIVVKLRLVINYELQAVLLSYTPDIEVLQPISLRQHMKEKYKSILKLLE